MKAIVAQLIFLALPSFVMSQTTYLLVGTYTGGGSEGIYVYKFNSQTGEAELVSTAASSNPSYLEVSPDKRFVYAVNENGDGKGAISAFGFNPENGQLVFSNEELTHGDHPCHVSIDKTGKWAVASNYSGGNFAVFGIGDDGSLRPASQIIKHAGKGPHPDRQEGPHVHSAWFSPDNRYLLVMDLGTDKLMTYAFDATSGKVIPAPVPFTATAPGAGPRHFAFSPSGKFGYVIEELTGAVSAYQYADGKLKQFQTISSLPADAKVANKDAGSADIHISPDGKFLYASNRGQTNTIAIYSINPENGKLSLKGQQPVLGKAPRNFNFDPSGRLLLVANMDSDEIVIFKRDAATGLLEDSGRRIKLSKPVCVKWVVE
ncbi:MAG: lactonase family protein [Candidatus Pseudobacter hemicellulosilyticus]|uniref:Lactonase family protein n=1 Tax=Candidatus Pseudobacter hemicellulosilyticus TaxID=3121375 RepID=A0AAJ5WP89_9BACT|nr:MAG: lactonase family protein [Pseudobacter sp.]